MTSRDATKLLDWFQLLFTLFFNSSHCQFVTFISHPAVLHLCSLCSWQDSELKRTVDESERIKRAYGHYFDLCIVNDGLEAAFRSLRLALEKLLMEQQWVPVSWVFWTSPRAHQHSARAAGQRSEDDSTLAASEVPCPRGGLVVGGVFMKGWALCFSANDQPHVEHFCTNSVFLCWA